MIQQTPLKVGISSKSISAKVYRETLREDMSNRRSSMILLENARSKNGCRGHVPECRVLVNYEKLNHEQDRYFHKHHVDGDDTS